MAYEEATYSIVYQNDVYEIRNYSDRLAIQVNYTNQDGGFGRLHVHRNQIEPAMPPSKTKNF